MRSLEDAEHRLADARANSAADKSSKNGSSPQKELEPDDEQKQFDGHNGDDRQDPRNGSKTLQIEELSIRSQGDKTKSNKTSVFSQTSSVRRVLDLELNALKEEEELQTRLKKHRRDAEQNERADLQEKLASKIAQKEIKKAKVPRSCGSSFRSASPVGTPDDNLTKVSGWMDKMEEAEIVPASINVPQGYQEGSVTTPVTTVQSTHGEQCSRWSMHGEQRCTGMDRTKTAIGAGSQIATAQLEVKFATSKLPMALIAGQIWVLPSNGGTPSSVFQVPQFTNRQKQYLPSQWPNFTSNAKYVYFINSSLPKLRLSEFSGDTLDRVTRVVGTIPSHCPPSKHRWQCKDESPENYGHRQGQECDCWLGIHRWDVQCGLERSSSNFWKNSNGCDCTTEKNILLSTDETIWRIPFDQVCENSVE